MTREEAIELIQKKISNDNLCRHMIAVGAIMKAVSTRFEANRELWELTGLLHDIDLGFTDDPALHGKIGSGWLKELGMPDEMVQAVLCHAGHSECRTPMEILLVAADQLSGLITACALVKEKKLANVTVKTVKKRFREARFAAGADREAMKRCAMAGIELDVLINDALTAMQSVSDELGL